MSGLGLDFGGQFRVSFVNEIVTKLQPLNLRDYFELDKSERDLGHPTGESRIELVYQKYRNVNELTIWYYFLVPLFSLILDHLEVQKSPPDLA